MSFDEINYYYLDYNSTDGSMYDVIYGDYYPSGVDFNYVSAYNAYGSNTNYNIDINGDIVLNITEK